MPTPRQIDSMIKQLEVHFYTIGKSTTVTF